MNRFFRLAWYATILIGLYAIVLAHSSDSSFDELFTQQPCPETCSSLQSSSSKVAGGGLRIFYLVLIHNERTARDALHLFRSIRHPRNTIVFHFDKRAANLQTVLDEEVASCPCGSTVRRESVHSVEWSKWSMNLPTLWGMELAITDYRDDWDIFINLSGDTLPVYNPDALANRLESLSYNFVTSRSCETGLFPTPVYDFPKVWHKRRHYTADETEFDPTFEDSSGERVAVTIHFGSQWVILQHGFVQWIVEQRNQSESWVAQFESHLAKSGKLMTDETYIPTLLMHAPEHFLLPNVTSTGELIFQNGTASTISHVRFERMDEHYPTAFGRFPDDQHYQVPSELLHLVDQPRVWGPYFLGVYDLGDVRSSGALFLRKVSAVVDANLVQLLPVKHVEEIPNITWPHVVNVTRKPDWSEAKALWARVVSGSTEGEDDEEL